MQVIVSRDGLDQGSEDAVFIEQVKPLLAKGGFIIRRHRQRFAPNQRNPLRIGGAGEAADKVNITRRAAPDVKALWE